MITNNILYKIKTALKLENSEILEAYRLENHEIEEKHLEAILKKEDDDNFKPCSYEELGIFLDGLITLKRGPSSSSNSTVELTNNLILKKLRIALELKDPEVEIIFGLAEIQLSKQEMKSLFRKEDHKNFRACSDELLMKFLEGVDEFYYTGEAE
jgi:uncharacterized protein YehS (DUF1456 family)